MGFRSRQEASGNSRIIIILVKGKNQEDNVSYFCFRNVSNIVFCATVYSFRKGKENGDSLKYVLYPIDSEYSTAQGYTLFLLRKNITHEVLE